MPERRTIAVAGRERTYRLYAPPGSGGRLRLPLVLSFHGGGTDAEFMADFCGLDEKADEAGFVVAYPDGTGRIPRSLTWNAGCCCGRAMRDNVDDVRFASELIDELVRILPIDRTRVYMTGMSNGAMLCYRLANEIADRIAAIAPVGGPTCQDRATPSRFVPICHFHGTRDQFAPYEGGIGIRSLTKTRFKSVPETIGLWTAAYDCEVVETEELPVAIEDGTHVTRVHYAGRRESAEIVLYTIHGGGHTWPGRETQLDYLGSTTKNIVANDIMWSFFERHTRAVE